MYIYEQHNLQGDALSALPSAPMPFLRSDMMPLVALPLAATVSRATTVAAATPALAEGEVPCYVWSRVVVALGD